MVKDNVRKFEFFFVQNVPTNCRRLKLFLRLLDDMIRMMEEGNIHEVIPKEY